MIIATLPTRLIAILHFFLKLLVCKELQILDVSCQQQEENFFSEQPKKEEKHEVSW